eukprot:5377287-Pyramimonas_sp.AAC.1
MHQPGDDLHPLARLPPLEVQRVEAAGELLPGVAGVKIAELPLLHAQPLSERGHFREVVDLHSRWHSAALQEGAP